MAPRILPCLLSFAFLAACTVREPGSLDRWDQEWFGSYADAPVKVVLPVDAAGAIRVNALRRQGGALVLAGRPEQMRGPLKEAWSLGRGKSYSLHGEQGGPRVREVGLRLMDGQVEAVARALHPRPFKLQLAADGNPIKEKEAEEWGLGIYYAEVIMHLKDNRFVDFQSLGAVLTEDESERRITTEARFEALVR
ncbi:MAG: hypothetical protein DWQ01_16640 [Planctomycetota bacterium]|nr:MAG: hypothetical protein DWQ01_16640 [Planctomycetota bacterium]